MTGESISPRAVVTGASGFIGSYLVDRLLSAGYHVRGLVTGRSGLPPARPGLEWVSADVRSRDQVHAAIRECDVVFHLASKVHAVSDYQENDPEYRQVNVVGTRHVVEAAIAAGARRLVFFSSVKAMGERTRGCEDEGAPTIPQTEYGRTKLQAERIVLDAGIAAGMRPVCLRLPMVYGSGNRGNLVRMIAAIDRGVFPPLPAEGGKRSIVHVDNVVQAALLAAHAAPSDGRVYLVTDERPYTSRELYDCIRAALGRSPIDWAVPEVALWVLGRLGDVVGRLRGSRFAVDTDAVGKLLDEACYRADRIEKELGYRPQKRFEDTLPEMVLWYRGESRR